MISIMGILNVTPDSFSDGGLYLNPDKALEKALQMEEEGADMIDIGGESTRPGALPVSLKDELERVLPILKKIAPRVKIPISMDTSKAAVASACLNEGASFINDVSALSDPEMITVVARADVPVILMHRKGEPQTMQKNPFYEDVVSEVFEFLKERIDFCLCHSIKKEKIFVDPGIGFGKTTEHNLSLLQNLKTLQALGCPIVVGASRKNFLRNLFGEKPEEVLAGSLTAALLAVERGADILRVHDVAKTKEVIRLANKNNFT